MISIIIPLYNAEKYIKECLESVVNQTFKDFECIVIDDGSTDAGGKIADLCAERDQRIKVFHTENKGVSNARNLGISQSNGEYIVFIDSDDYVTTDYLENLISALAPDIDLVTSGMLMVENEITSTIYSSEEKYLITISNLNTHIYTKLAGLIHGPVCKIYRKSIIIQNNIKFKSDLTLGEDLYFNLDYIGQCRTIKFIPTPDYYYRRVEGSLTKKNKIRLHDLYQANLHHKNFLIKIGGWDDITADYIYKQLGGYIYDAIFNSNNDFIDIKSYFKILDKKDISSCISHCKYPKWFRNVLKYKAYRTLWMILYVNNKWLR